MLGGTWEASAATAVILTLLLVPVARRAALAAGMVDQPSSRKIHSEPVPYLGGVAMAVGVLAGVMVGPQAGGSMVLILAGALLLVVTGAIDDREALPPWVRLLIQVAAASVAMAAGVMIDLADVWLLDAAMTLVVVVAVTNAFNMLDNMDGLAAGVAAVSTTVVAVAAATTGQVIVCAVAAAVAAAACGFLAFNLGGASIFMGDAGSTFVGYMVAVVVIELNPVDESRIVALAAAWLLLFVPFVDLCTVTASRLRRGVSVASAGTDHLSHRLVRHGYSRSGAVAVLVAAQAVASALALVLLSG